MIHYSHVCLAIPCWLDSPDEISKRLGVNPSRVLAEPKYLKPAGKEMTEVVLSTWVLDSPESVDPSYVEGRLWALANTIEPFSQQLLRLPSRYEHWIDVLYYWGSDNPLPHMMGFRASGLLLQQLARLQLALSFEIISVAPGQKPDLRPPHWHPGFMAPDFWRDSARKRVA